MNGYQRLIAVVIALVGFGAWSLPALAHPGHGTHHASAGGELRTGYYGGRLVTYEVRGDLAIYEGDIVLGTVAEMEGRLTPPKGSGLGFPTRLWPLVGGVRQVPYLVQSDPGPTGGGGPQVPGAVTAFNNQLAGVIQFVPRTAEADYVNFNFGAADVSGVCFSFVGRIGGAQEIGGSRECTQSVILHEMGHAIGMWHEQQRNDRNTYVTVNYNNIDKQYVNNFDQLLSDEDDLGLYDYGSTMHYNPFSFSKNGGPTIETIPAGILIREGGGFSSGDIDAMKRLYNQVPSLVTVTSNPAGLEVSVDGTNCTTPCGPFNWALASTHTLNVPTATQTLTGTTYTYGRWNDNMAVSHMVTVSPGDGRRTHPNNRPAVTVYAASFRRLWPYSSQIIPAASGTVGTNPNPQPFPPVAGNFYVDRTQLTLTATPNGGNNFYQWFGVTSPVGANPKTFYVTFALDPVQAVFTTSPITTIATNPPGLRVLVDGNDEVGSKNFGDPTQDPTWTNGSNHPVNATSPQNASGTQNTRYTFQSWSDGGAQNHNIAHGPGNQTFTANYTVEYQVRTQVRPGQCAGTVTPATGFQAGGANVQFQATGQNGMVFAGWSGDLSGATNPQTVPVNDQMLVTANFNTVATPLAVTSLNPASRPAGSGAFLLTINGTGFTANTNVFFNGNFYAPATTSPTELTVNIPGTDITSVGALRVTVQNVSAGQCGAQAESQFQVLFGPTAVRVASFSARAVPGGADVRWRTGSEIGTLGFNVWRRAGLSGKYAKVNAALIPAKGAGGSSYSYRDAHVLPGRTYHYRLEAIGSGGTRWWAGAARFQARKGS